MKLSPLKTFVHRLALSFGCTVRELSLRMSLDELMEWVAFYELEPWGSHINGLRASVNTAAVYNSGLMVANPKKLRSKPFDAKDFFVGGITSNKKRVKTWREQRDTFLLFFPKGKKNDSR